MGKVSPHRPGLRPMAYVMLCYRGMTPRTLWRGIPSLSWGEAMELRLHVREHVSRIRQFYKRRLVIYAEDFACRWVLDARSQVNGFVFDTPILGVDECMGKPTMLDLPAFVRRTTSTALEDWDWLRLPFNRRDWLCQNMTIADGPIGEWKSNLRCPPKVTFRQYVEAAASVR